jgi:putative hydrolase of the HAD superfamily
VAEIDAVLFDWGGTLTPFNPIDLLEIWGASAVVLAPERPAELAAALVTAELALWQQTRDTMASFTTEQLVQRAAGELGIDIDPATYPLAIAAYRQQWAPHVIARQHAVDVVRDLRARGLRTGVLSNTNWPRTWHDEALAADGLLDLFDATVYTSELTHMKPHPSAFEALLGAVGTTAERAVFVGDRRYDDIGGAQALGMRTVWIRNDAVPGHDVQPDATIEELPELLDVVDRWL